MRSSLVVFLAVALLAVSCTSLIPGKGQTGGETATGTKGLALSFLANAPPKRVLDAEQFDIVVELQNLGAEPIERVLLDLSGFDPNTLRVGGTTRIVDNLDGTRVTKVPGYAVEEWSASINPESIIDTYIPALLVTGCYSYRTVAAATVCIDTGFGKSDVGSKACSPANIKISQGQGAPVAVTEIDIEPSSKFTRFIITVENLGNGLVFDTRPGSGKIELESCSPRGKGLERIDIDKVTIEDARVGDSPIIGSCRPDNGGLVQARLVNGKAVFICEYNYAEGGSTGLSAFRTPITITLGYGYRTSVSKQIEIVKTPG